MSRDHDRTWLAASPFVLNHRGKRKTKAPKKAQVLLDNFNLLWGNNS
jgi:hypothetical protein